MGVCASGRCYAAAAALELHAVLQQPLPTFTARGSRSPAARQPWRPALGSLARLRKGLGLHGCRGS